MEESLNQHGIVYTRRVTDKKVSSLPEHVLQRKDNTKEKKLYFRNIRRRRKNMRKSERLSKNDSEMIPENTSYTECDQPCKKSLDQDYSWEILPFPQYEMEEPSGIFAILKRYFGFKS